MQKTLFALLLFAVCSYGKTDSSQISQANSAGALLVVGDAICMLSVRGFFPGVYDVGILTMMGGKGKLNRTYQEKFQEAPPQFGESGESAYKWGWIYKGAAIGSLFIGAESDNVGIGLVGFVIFYLTGVAKHWEASRLLFDEGSNTKSLILDETQPVSRLPPDGVKVGYTFAF